MSLTRHQKKLRVLEVIKKFGPIAIEDICDVAPYASLKEIQSLVQILKNEGAVSGNDTVEATK